MHNDSIGEAIGEYAEEAIAQVIEILGETKESEMVEGIKPTPEPVTVESVVKLALVTYPEHEKLNKIVDKSAAIGEFVAWLNNTKNIFLAEWHKGPGRSTTEILGYARTNIQALLAEFFEIDQEKLSKEKDAMSNAVALRATLDRLSKEPTA